MNLKDTNQPTVELSSKLTDDEVTAYRAAITQRAAQSDWQEAAIRYFASLRARAARYQVRELGRSYNATL
jgi:hypothetical protein